MDSSTRLFVIVGDLMHIGDAPLSKPLRCGTSREFSALVS
jgi:hypothetical protein